MSLQLEYYVFSYIIELRNQGIKSFKKAEIVYDMKKIGIKNSESAIDDLIRKKKLLRLKSGKLLVSPAKTQARSV